MQDGQELERCLRFYKNCVGFVKDVKRDQNWSFISSVKIPVHEEYFTCQFIKMNLISFSLNKRRLFIPRQVVVASSAFIDPMFVIWDFSKFGSIYEILELKLELINFTTSDSFWRWILFPARLLQDSCMIMVDFN